MQIKKLTELRPYFYHLTHPNNVKLIYEGRQLICTNSLIEQSDLNNKEKHMRTRRLEHLQLCVNGSSVNIRDQKPLIPILLERCLVNCSQREYIYYLNEHVFLWAKLDGLKSHYGRYKEENPVILKFKSMEFLELNKSPLCTHLNSGALRAIPYYAGEHKGIYYGGNAPHRGLGTFKKLMDYEGRISAVKEITFKNGCIIPDKFEIGSSPNGEWESIEDYLEKE